VTQDVYFKKEVVLEHERRSLRLRVAQDLFSSFDVDAGTRLLLRTLAGYDAGEFRRILDLGCGYGPLGLALKMADPRRLVHMVDRDALAVEYTRQNAALNGLDGVQSYGSLGYDDVSLLDFDLIVANVPGKANKAVISHFLVDAGAHLRPGGLLAAVVVAPLVPTVASVLSRSPGIDVVFRKSTASYHVFHCRFQPSDPPSGTTPRSGLDAGLYRRGSMAANAGGSPYTLETAYGLPEFDSVGFQSELLLKALADPGSPAVERALLFNPGQGHVPVALWKLTKPGSIALVDRDLLALRYSTKNLVLNGCPEGRITTSHQVGTVMDGMRPIDLVAGVLRGGEEVAEHALIVEQGARELLFAGHVLVAGGSTAITRLLKQLRSARRLTVESRKRRKGSSVLRLILSAAADDAR
jgi:16S rRNA G1207 methylase RsmC